MHAPLHRARRIEEATALWNATALAVHGGGGRRRAESELVLPGSSSSLGERRQPEGGPGSLRMRTSASSAQAACGPQLLAGRSAGGPTACGLAGLASRVSVRRVNHGTWLTKDRFRGLEYCSLALKKKSIINSNSLRGNIHTEKVVIEKARRHVLITFDFAIAELITRVWTMSMTHGMTQIRFLVVNSCFLS
jgi:hypothetical protein